MKEFCTIACVVLNTTALICLLLTGCSAGQQGQTRIEKCIVKSKDRVDYNLVFEHRNSLSPNMLIVNIVVKQKNFNRDFMTGLAKTLTSRYCHDNNISVAIFDEKEAAKKVDMWNYLLGKIEAPAVRGFYALDREKKIAHISFSTERGKPRNEVMIELPIGN